MFCPYCAVSQVVSGGRPPFGMFQEDEQEHRTRVHPLGVVRPYHAELIDALEGPEAWKRWGWADTPDPRDTATPTIRFQDLRAGLVVDQALEAFRAGCNKGPDCLFITPSWFAPYAERIRAGLTGPLTEDHVMALRAIVAKQESLDFFVEWVTRAPELSPADFRAWAADQREAGKMERMVRQYVDWYLGPLPIPTGDPDAPFHSPTWQVWPLQGADVAELLDAHASDVDACPGCGTPPEGLTWRLAHYDGMHRRAGNRWTALLISCEGCRLGIAEITWYQGVA